MKDVILKYNEETNEICDINGNFIITWYELQYKEVPQVSEHSPDELDKITKLKAMMSVNEIIKLKDAGLL